MCALTCTHLFVRVYSGASACVVNVLVILEEGKNNGVDVMRKGKFASTNPVFRLYGNVDRM